MYFVFKRTKHLILSSNLKHVTTFKKIILLKQQGNVLNLIENSIHLFPLNTKFKLF